MASRLLALLTLGIVAFGLAQAVEPAVPPAAPTQSVTVLPGQSLWEIASLTNPDVDPRVTIAEIRTLNGLESSLVRPGTTLAVPVIGGRP